METFLRKTSEHLLLEIYHRVPRETVATVLEIIFALNSNGDVALNFHEKVTSFSFSTSNHSREVARSYSLQISLATHCKIPIS